MATESTNLKLEIPELNDFISHEMFARNFNIIDDAVSAINLDFTVDLPATAWSGNDENGYTSQNISVSIGRKFKTNKKPIVDIDTSNLTSVTEVNDVLSDYARIYRVEVSPSVSSDTSVIVVAHATAKPSHGLKLMIKGDFQ